MVIAQIDETVLAPVDLGAPVKVQADGGLVALPPIGVTSADTYQQITEEASYGVSTTPSLTIGGYQPSSNYANNLQGLVRGLFGQLPDVLDTGAGPAALTSDASVAAPGDVNRSPLLWVGLGLVALSVLAVRR